MLVGILLSLSLTGAIIQVESGGNDNAVGDNGRALGSMQIWQCVWDDVKSSPTLQDYTYQDVKKRKIALIVFRLYMARYATKKRLGRTPTFQDKARIWNGGPNGYKKQATVKYWNKVKELMK
tara:strand:+ start:1376 stop:1741 length:366 start_codon:yes stop_codon:yes gene_type:complete